MRNFVKKEEIDSNQIGVFVFVVLPQTFYCAYLGNKSMINQAFLSITYHSIFLASCMHAHTKYQVKYLMPNLFSKVKKYGSPMGSSNQCHTKHSRKIWARHPRDKKRLARLIDLFKNHIKTVAVHPQDPLLLLNQQVPRPFIPTTSHLPRGTYRSNLQPPNCTSESALVRTKTPPSSNPSSNLKNCPKGPKLIWIGSNRTRSLSYMLSYFPSY